MYTAVIHFIDADNGKEYHVGDEVSIDGKDESRIKQMTTKDNRAFQVLMEEVKETSKKQASRKGEKE